MKQKKNTQVCLFFLEQKLKNVFNKVVQESEQKNLLTDSGLSIRQSLYELNPKWCTPIISIDSPLNCTEIPSQISLEEFEWPSSNLAETVLYESFFFVMFFSFSWQLKIVIKSTINFLAHRHMFFLYGNVR